VKIKTYRTGLIILLVFAVLFAMALQALAIDPPHNPASGVQCNDCHTVMSAGGSSLTKNAVNSGLCMSCHFSGAFASNMAFADAMQATPGVNGTSHSWEGAMPEFSDPSNAYGLRNTEDLDSQAMKTRLRAFGGVISCSVCHNQHSQGQQPWDSDSDQTYTATVSNNRHFMRDENDYNQLCEDCHYYRAMTYADAKDESKANGTTKFSHPVGEVMNTIGLDYEVPLGANGLAQTNSPSPSLANRFALDSDGNPNESNFVLGPGGKVRCLSCHRVHYVDSNAMSNSTDVK
jgi:predicted CXXCH cytochrome family protein